MFVSESSFVIFCGTLLLSNQIGISIVSSIVSKMIQKPRVSLRVSSRFRGSLPPLTAKNKTIIIGIVSTIVSSQVASIVAIIQQPWVSLRISSRSSCRLRLWLPKGHGHKGKKHQSLDHLQDEEVLMAESAPM